VGTRLKELSWIMYIKVSIVYMTNNLEAKLCFECHYSAKIVDLFDAELANLFSVCANIVNCWYMKILQLEKVDVY